MALNDLMARAQAAGGLMGPEEAPPMDEPMPEEMMGGGAPDLETALAGVEASLEGMAPEQAEEIRTHLNAIREIAAASGGAGEEVPPPSADADAAPPELEGAPAAEEKPAL